MGKQGMGLRFGAALLAQPSPELAMAGIGLNHLSSSVPSFPAETGAWGRHLVGSPTRPYYVSSATHIVVPCRPAWVELHVQLPFLSGQLIILGLLFPRQRVPLQWGRGQMGCVRELAGCTRLKVVRGQPGQPTRLGPHPAAQDLVDGGALLERALCNDLGSHLLHVQHESIEWLLDSWLLGFLLCLGFSLCLPEGHMSCSDHLGAPRVSL